MFALQWKNTRLTSWLNYIITKLNSVNSVLCCAVLCSSNRTGTKSKAQQKFLFVPVPGKSRSFGLPYNSTPRLPTLRYHQFCDLPVLLLTWRWHCHFKPDTLIAHYTLPKYSRHPKFPTLLFCTVHISGEGARGGAVGWGTWLQAERTRVRFPMVSLEFFIDIILPVALWPRGWLSL